jgi:hydroxypyruvate reductase
MDYSALLLESFDKVVEASVPQNCLPPFIPEPPKAGKTYIVGAGKAAAKMAQVFEQHYKGKLAGTVITRYSFVAETEIIKVVEASHPNPDQAGRDAAKEILEIAEQATEDDLVICLLSGGGSALLSCPPEEVDFDELKNLNDQLLKCGASIHEINCVRKHLNKAFGGKLAVAAAPARVVTLSISDVSGDNPSSIASGPTVGDPTTLADAKRVIKKYKLTAGPSVIAYLEDAGNETPKPDDEVFLLSDYQLIATPEKSLQAAAAFFEENNITPYIISSELEGDTNECAFFHAAMAKRILEKDQPFKKPCAIISGGETTVKVEGRGQGGPNTQFMLKLAIELDGIDNAYALACDTDGIDGIMDNAGAIIGPNTLKRAQANDLSPKAYLENNDSYNFFKVLDDLIIPGPTHTNVNDYRVIILV